VFFLLKHLLNFAQQNLGYVFLKPDEIIVKGRKRLFHFIEPFKDKLVVLADRSDLFSIIP